MSLELKDNLFFCMYFYIITLNKKEFKLRPERKKLLKDLIPQLVLFLISKSFRNKFLSRNLK